MRLSKLIIMAGILCMTSAPVFSQIGGTDNGKEQVKNVQNGARNASTGWVEIFDSVATHEGKAKNTAEKLTGFIAGATTGTGKALHKTGAGIIELGTFWMPKKEPQITKINSVEKQADQAQTGSTQNFAPRRDY